MRRLSSAASAAGAEYATSRGPKQRSQTSLASRSYRVLHSLHFRASAGIWGLASPSARVAVSEDRDSADPSPHLPGIHSWCLMELPPSPDRSRPGGLAG